MHCLIVFLFLLLFFKQLFSPRNDCFQLCFFVLFCFFALVLHYAAIITFCGVTGAEETI